MKKVIFLSVIIVAFFSVISWISIQADKKEEAKVESMLSSSQNPYDDKELKPETIEQLSDPLYQNQIMPGELNKLLADKTDLFVYFYSPTCIHCQNVSPYLVPLADKLNIDLKKFNIYEFEQGWVDYQITGTPTVIRYKNGVEVARIEGEQEESTYNNFFEDTK